MKKETGFLKETKENSIRLMAEIAKQNFELSVMLKNDNTLLEVERAMINSILARNNSAIDAELTNVLSY
jgi:hypothetical protein